MEVDVLRGKLHEYIDSADERYLAAIYVLVEQDIPSNYRQIYDPAFMEELYKRQEDHHNGISKSYTVEESMEYIRQHKKQKDL